MYLVKSSSSFSSSPTLSYFIHEKKRVGWMFPRCPIHNAFMGSCREEHHQPVKVNVVSTSILSDKWFRSKSRTYQRQNAALGCGAARGTAVLEGLHGGAVGSWRKEKRSASGSIREGIRLDTYEPRKSRRQLHRHRPGSKEGCRVLGRRNPERAPGSWLG